MQEQNRDHRESSGTDSGLSGAFIPRDPALDRSDYERLNERGRFLYPAGRTTDGVPAFRMHEIDLVVLDIDNTIAFPNSSGLGAQLRDGVHKALAKELSLSIEDAQRVADHYRLTKGGGEFAFLDPRIGFKLIELSARGHLPIGQTRPRMQALWEEFAGIDSSPFFAPLPDLREHVQEWRRTAKVVAVTDSVRPMALKTLGVLGIDPERDFDHFRAWERDDLGPPKRIEPGSAFSRILEQQGIQARRAVSIGDSPDFDILPAMAVGMKVVHVGASAIPKITSIKQLVL
jgi:FMN phosphatase YigB (HAD superfamily)